MLGKTYLGLKDKDKALLWLAKAKDYPGRTHEDKEVEHQLQRSRSASEESTQRADCTIITSNRFKKKPPNS